MSHARPQSDADIQRANVAQLMEVVRARVKDVLKEIDSVLVQQTGVAPNPEESESILKLASKVEKMIKAEEGQQTDAVELFSKISKLLGVLDDALSQCKTKVNDVEACYQFVKMDQNAEIKIAEKERMDAEKIRIDAEEKMEVKQQKMTWPSFFAACLLGSKSATEPAMESAMKTEREQAMKGFEESKLETLADFKESLKAFHESYDALNACCSNTANEIDHHKQKNFRPT